MPISFDSSCDKENIIPSSVPLQPSFHSNKPLPPSRPALLCKLQSFSPSSSSPSPRGLSTRLVRPLAGLQPIGSSRLIGAQRFVASEVREDSSDDEEEDAKPLPPPPCPSPPPPSPPPPPPPPPPPASPSLPPFHLSGSPYFPIFLLGKGATSSVYKVRSKDHQVFALKVISLDSSTPSALLSLETEVDCMRRLRGNPYAIQLFHAERSAQHFYILLECGTEDLNSYISSLHCRSAALLHPIELRRLWLSMLNGVHACHNVGILHRDLKPANFVLVDGKWKIIDFGIAKVMGEGEAGETAVISLHLTGTINYMSPESLESEGGTGEKFRQNRKSDIWSLGCILYQIIYGKPPFADIQGVTRKMRAICDSKHNILFPEQVGEQRVEREVREVMQLCLERDPNKRASIKDLLYHRFLIPGTY